MKAINHCLGAVLALSLIASVACASSPEDVYDETADGRVLLKEALEKAKKEDKRVFITWGANWCGPCHSFNKLCKTDPTIQKLLTDHYVSVKIDVGRHNKHVELGKEHGLSFDNFYIPHVTIVDKDGKVVAQGKYGTWTPPAKDGSGNLRVEEGVARFLDKHKVDDLEEDAKKPKE